MFRNAPFLLLALLAMVIAGFWPTYFSLPAADTRLSLHVHSISMLLWFGLLIAQPWLIRTQRRSLHRALGKLSLVIIPVLAISGTVIVFGDYAHNYDEPFGADALGIFFFGLWSIAMMVGFWGLGLYHRQNVQLHARCMLATAITLIAPGSFRLQMALTGAEDWTGPFFTNLVLVLLVSVLVVVGDKLRGKIYPPFVYMAVAWAINTAAFKFIYLLPGWHRFAAWSLELYS